MTLGEPVHRQLGLSAKILCLSLNVMSPNDVPQMKTVFCQGAFRYRQFSRLDIPSVPCQCKAPSVKHGSYSYNNKGHRICEKNPQVTN